MIIVTKQFRVTWMAVAMFLGVHGLSASEQGDAGEASAHPSSYWGVEAGPLFRVGNYGTPLDYTMISLSVSYFGAPHFVRSGDYGHFSVRPRFNLLAQSIVKGPENYFIGVVAGPLLEWQPTNDPWRITAGAGGGIGFLDSKGQTVSGAQGQDLNFVWYLSAGLVYDFNPNWSVSAELYFQHLSNLGMNKVNPGLDVLGPRIGLSYRF